MDVSVYQKLQKNSLQVLRNILLVTSAILILLPSAVSFSHIFTEHSHQLCKNYADDHYHEKSLDCELHKFHKKSALSFDFPTYEIIPVISESLSIFDYYKFLNDYEPLHYDLRGPPAIT